MKHRIVGGCALLLAALLGYALFGTLLDPSTRLPSIHNGSKIAAFLPLGLVFGAVLLVGGPGTYARLVDATDRPTKLGWVVIVVCLAMGFGLAIFHSQTPSLAAG